LSVTPQ
jgi:hypothetical protein